MLTYAFRDGRFKNVYCLLSSFITFDMTTMFNILTSLATSDLPDTVILVIFRNFVISFVGLSLSAE